MIAAQPGEVVLVDQHRVEVQSLHQHPLAHKALERGRPALADHLQPVDVDVCQGHHRQRGRLGFPLLQLVVGHDQVDELAAVGRRQPGIRRWIA